MPNLELIEQVKEALYELAELEKSGSDSNEMSNYHLVSSQIMKINLLIEKDIEPSQILSTLKSLQKTALPELKSELPKMIEEEHKQKAEELYEEITIGINAIADALEQSVNELRPQ